MMSQKQKTQLGKTQNLRARQSAAKPKLKAKEYEEQIAKEILPAKADLPPRQKAKRYEEPDYPYHFVPEKY